MSVRTRKPFNGRHMTLILVAGFGVVVAVNVTMATLASSTFGGVVVENSYVASQDFNRWLDEAEKERALGWRLDARRQADGRVAVALTAAPSLLRQAQDERALRQAQDERVGGDVARPAQAELVEAPAVQALTVNARHPLGRRPDMALTFRREGARWVSVEPLPAGRWTLRFEARADDRTWRTEKEIGA